MLLTRTKNLIDQVSFIEKLTPNTISDEELESLYYGIHNEKRYFQASETQKLNNWDKPTDEHHSKTDTIIDLILNIAPAMTDDALRSINRRLITIEQTYAEQNQVKFMRKATLAKYLLAYEIFRIETNTTYSNERDIKRDINRLIEDTCTYIEKKDIKAPEIDTLRNLLILAKLHLLIHLLNEKIEQLKDSNKYPKRSKEFNSLKDKVQIAVEQNHTEKNKISIYKELIAFYLQLNANIATEHHRQFKKRQKKEAALLRFEHRSISAMNVQEKISKETRPSSAIAGSSCYETTKSGLSKLMFFSDQDLSGKYSKSPGIRSSSSTSGTSSMSSSLSGLGQGFGSTEIQYLEKAALYEEGTDSQDEDNLPKEKSIPSPYRPGV